MKIKREKSALSNVNNIIQCMAELRKLFYKFLKPFFFWRIILLLHFFEKCKSFKLYLT
jgi:hypothetical protein